MKRTIYRFLAGCCFALLAGGCQKDLLKTIPNDRITSEIFWTEEKDAVLAVNAIYTYLEGVSIFSYDALSDIARPNQNFMQESYIVKGTYDALNPFVVEKWDNAYKGIRAVNYFLENVDKVPTDNMDLITRLKGEARFLRAYFYIQLTTLFGDVPLITKSLSIEEGKTVQRTPATEVYDFIGEELTAAAAELPVDASEPGRITKGAALAFKARLMLLIKRYDEAAQAAAEVMALDKYELYPSYENLFSYSAENNSEVILDKQFTENIYANNSFALLAPYSQTASGNIVPVKKLVDAYQMQNGKGIEEAGSGFDPHDPYANRDPRLHYSIFVLGSQLPDGTTYDSRPGSGTADAIGYNPGSTKTGFNVKKYVNAQDRNDRDNSGINIILMRYAEVLLTYAEAKIELNQVDASVFEAINEVRQRADVGMPAITAPKSQEEMRSIVRRERMIELAFEGQRFFDIRRYGIAGEVMNGTASGMTYTNSSGDLVTVTDNSFIRFFDPDRDVLWPIPQKELDLNPGLTPNPGW
ncbi:putative outer membrane starch-binding protein [Anseongella ginsenosidimutans]|uniref:Putative outer membrane starch-binding protein n=1 Tax=Anseongella ginsenosidimutans TaxID=496056 RepID=A0A4R3KUX7_9SPHI|nr:RagB/SusD family nutrient uptake outer membrane protein [Anseongella ginsenosidimutans]QEC51867.1 RagB/SusD family nutrient uptake outer membrane protein [Anseongella ginsenosidimutans]TCS89249.1 putative outer membrane starch-binding protein [Anseongella ginsenosidimutans]